MCRKYVKLLTNERGRWGTDVRVVYILSAALLIGRANRTTRVRAGNKKGKKT